MKPILIVIAGPTAVGKTVLSIELAKFYQCPIVSADSRQFFKEMSIGTAKPTELEMSNVPHYFINNKSIHETYNAGQYEKEAIKLLATLFKEHNMVILVGGSGLYINAILNGVDEFEEIPLHIREEINEAYKAKGIHYLQKQLKLKDEAYYHQVDLQNPQRLIRALEVCTHTGKPFSTFRNKEKKIRDFDSIHLLINSPREILYERINHRVDVMMQQGLLDEVKNLYPYKHLNALNTVGYKELFDYLDGKLTLERAIDLIKQNTRHFAKRQLTWFKHQGDFENFEPTDIDKIKAYIDILSNYL